MSSHMRQSLNSAYSASEDAIKIMVGLCKQRSYRNFTSHLLALHIMKPSLLPSTCCSGKLLHSFD
jgi:hypothetical protein